MTRFRVLPPRLVAELERGEQRGHGAARGACAEAEPALVMAAVRAPHSGFATSMDNAGRGWVVGPAEALTVSAKLQQV